MVEFNLITGFPTAVIDTLNRKIGQYKRHYTSIKVGITGQEPAERFAQHLQAFDWEKMIVIYSSQSEKNCNQIEAMLVECHYNDLTNVRQGGGSELRERGKNYVYVLLKT